MSFISIPINFRGSLDSHPLTNEIEGSHASTHLGSRAYIDHTVSFIFYFSTEGFFLIDMHLQTREKRLPSESKSVAPQNDTDFHPN